MPQRFLAFHCDILITHRGRLIKGEKFPLLSFPLRYFCELTDSNSSVHNEKNIQLVITYLCFLRANIRLFKCEITFTGADIEFFYGGEL